MIFFVLILLSCLVNVCVAAGAAPPVSYVLSPLYKNRLRNLSLIGGEKIAIPNETRKTPGKVVFEDLVPGANWGHPAKLKFYSANGALVQETNVTRPPEQLEEQWVAPEELFQRPKAPKFDLQDYQGAWRVKDPSLFHAFLINGNANQRHWNDFSFLFRVLTQVYGYDKSNIWVYDSHYKEIAPDLDGDGKPDIQFGSTVAEVREGFSRLKSSLTKADRLLVVMNDHGSFENKLSKVILKDGDVDANEFGTWINGAGDAKVLSLFEQCFSGGFVRRALGPSHVALAASKDEELSWATPDLAFDEFFYHVIAAFAGQDHEGNRLPRDPASDNKISAKEAFAYAIQKDRRPESPLLEAANNSGDAAQIGLGF